MSQHDRDCIRPYKFMPDHTLRLPPQFAMAEAWGYYGWKATDDPPYFVFGDGAVNSWGFTMQRQATKNGFVVEMFSQTSGTGLGALHNAASGEAKMAMTDIDA